MLRSSLSHKLKLAKACGPLLLLVLTGVTKAERLPLKSYTVADGLPSNVINNIVRDTRGFMWFCTAEGLSLFDGYRFTNYGTDEGLPHPNVTDILQTRGGDYWVATSGGLARFNPKGVPGSSQAEPPNNPMFKVFTPAGEDRSSQSFTALLESRDGTIWCGTMRGLFRVAQTEGRTVLSPVNIGLPTEYALSGAISALVEDRHGTLWVGAATGLYRRWPDGTTARYTTKDGLPDENLHTLLLDSLGNLWVATRIGGLFRLAFDAGHQPPTITRSYNSKNAPISNWIHDLHESSDGKLWASTNLELVEFPLDEKKPKVLPRVYTKRNGFSYHAIWNVTEDREGNLWLGTIMGAMKLVRNGFVTFGETDGIQSIFSLFESSAGEFYAVGFVDDGKASISKERKVDITNLPVTYSFNVGQLSGNRFTWLLPNVLRNVNISWSDKPFVTQARTGEWWFARYLFPRVGTFLDLKRARPLAFYPAKTSEPDAVVYCIYEDSRGDVWIATSSSISNGLSRWDHSTRTISDMEGTTGLPSLKEILPISFQEDRAGNVWVGFSGNGGLARYSAGWFTVFKPENGLPQGRINDLYLDREARLWVAAARGGLARVDDPTSATPAFVNYSTSNGLSSNFINAITEDAQGRIYAGTGRGVDRITLATGHVKHFTTADGLAPGEILAALSDRRGALWFGTRQGLSRLIPEPDQPSSPPPILINGLRLAGEKQTVSALGETEITLPELGSNKNQLQIDFVGLSFASGETLRYQHKLEGADSDWSALSDQRTVNYASLSPGKYRFVVRAVNSDGVASIQPASISFTILPPVWMRRWFIALVAAIVVLSIYGIYRYRVSRILEVTNIRARIATDLHDDIGANLTKITLLSEVARRQLEDSEATVTSSGNPLATIARISRESVASMSDIVWAINPQRDSFRDLVRRMRPHAEELFTLRGVELLFNAPDDGRNLKLGADVRRDLFLFFKEAVNNVARHSSCTRVKIDLRAEGNWISLSITDNGVGFDRAIESGGHGLAGMRRRAQSLGGSVEIDSRVGHGTTVRLRVPAGGVHIPTRLHR